MMDPLTVSFVPLNLVRATKMELNMSDFWGTGAAWRCRAGQFPSK